MRDVVIVKLGGSLITDKGRLASLRADVLRRLCGEISEALGLMPEALLVAHGSGSFGHAAAEVHGLSAGARATTAGIAETQAQARRLHELVLAALREAGVECFSFVPGSAMVMDEAVEVSLHAEPLRLALELGLVPVSFGDVVLDRSRGASICSTEVLLSAVVASLSQQPFRVRRILWLGDTDGVYDEAGETIPEISRESSAAVLARVGEAAGTDVTGGMRLRIETGLRLAVEGVTSHLVNGLETGLLRRALLNQETSGTRIAAIRSD